MYLKHMKSLIALVVGLLAVGCGKTEQPLEPSQLSAEPPPANSPPNPTDQNTTKAEPVRELTPEERQKKALRDSVLGEYELKGGGDIYNQVYLDNGVNVNYHNGKKVGESKWSIVDGEIHAASRSGAIDFFRINKDKSIIWIAQIHDGKRKDFPKKFQYTYKKIK